MRVAQVFAPYPAYIDYFDRKLFSIQASNELGYGKLKAYLDQDSMGWTDQWKEPLRSFGIQFENFTSSYSRLQFAWARENALKTEDLDEILIAQLKDFQPDVLFVLNFNAISSGLLERLSHELPSLNSKILWAGAALPASCPIECYDLVVSCVPEIQRALAAQGAKAEFIRHSFDSRVLSQLANASKRYALSFVGQVALIVWIQNLT
jgi:hypothetical protein